MLLLIGAAQAMTVDEAVLPYDRVGFDPGAEDEAPRGGELLTAGPAGQIALYNPVDAEVLLLGEDLETVGRIEAVGVGSMAWDASGRLLLYQPHQRTLSLHGPDGTLVGAASLPDIVPPGGTLALAQTDVYIADVFGNLHRAARITDGRLAPPDGPSLVEATGRVRWDARAGVLTADGIDWPMPDAIKASGQLIGEDWLLIDAVVAESPITATRTAWCRETGEPHALPVSSRRYVPRLDVAEDALGRLLYLDPRLDGLYLVRVTP